MTKHTKDLLGGAAGCFFGYGLLLSLGGGLGQIAIARYLFLAGLGIALLVIILDTLKGSLFRSIIGVTLMCVAGFGVGYLPYQYLLQETAGKPIITLGTSTTNSTPETSGE